jgi:hypothetical protein
MRQKQGDKFSVKDFNNQFLSYGSAPVKSIRELMRANVQNDLSRSANRPKGSGVFLRAAK